MPLQDVTCQTTHLPSFLCGNDKVEPASKKCLTGQCVTARLRVRRTVGAWARPGRSLNPIASFSGSAAAAAAAGPGAAGGERLGQAAASGLEPAGRARRTPDSARPGPGLGAGLSVSQWQLACYDGHDSSNNPGEPSHGRAARPGAETAAARMYAGKLAARAAAQPA
eukprot:766568-Hanusia_phi.AAC.2